MFTARYVLDEISPISRKDKVHSRTGLEVQEEGRRYSSTLSLTSVQDGVGGQPTLRLLYPRERPRNL